MSAFITWWEQFYPTVKPIQWNLKCDLSDLWVRFYSLPFGKRYPESEQEYMVLLERHNSVAYDLLEFNEIWVVYSCYKGASELTDVLQSTNLKFNFESEMQNPDPDTPSFIFYSCKSSWENGKYDALIKLVADDKIRSILFANITNGNLFCPYDGGADLIIPNPDEKKRIKIKYKEWLSSREDGL